MRCFSVKLWLALGAPLVFTACATIAPPQPPSLQLLKPPNDLRAARKGDRVILTWTVPRITTDRQTVRSLGPTRICRGPEPELLLCGTPVGEVSQASPTPAKSSGQKITLSYTDQLTQGLLGDNSSSFITYAIE